MRREADDHEDRWRRLPDELPPEALAEGDDRARDDDPARRAVGTLQRTAGNAAVARAVAADAGSPGRAVAERLIPGPGRRLDPAVRAGLERRLGAGLGGMRVHTGPDAARAARALGARAYATGRDVVFDEGAFDPSTADGRELLTHEAAHVVQQEGSHAAAAASPEAEREAREAGRREGPGVARPLTAGAPLQADMDEALQGEWQELSRMFEADAGTPGPVVLAEGLHQTAGRTARALDRTREATADERDKSRLKRAGDDLAEGEKELPDLVQQLEPRKLPEVTDALEQMVEGLDEIERIREPGLERTRHSRELTKVTRGAARLESALPSSTWRAHIAAAAALAGLARDFATVPSAAGGGGDDDGEGGDGAADTTD